MHAELIGLGSQSLCSLMNEADKGFRRMQTDLARTAPSPVQSRQRDPQRRARRMRGSSRS